jgi:hypothetical protein|nr:MAG: hypothetical protein DIU67_02560 [Actinomycetota bacterium]
MGDDRAVSHFRSEGDRIVASLSPQEKAFLSDVVPMLASIGPGDPALDRLTPPVILGDPEANEEWWRLMGPELREAKSSDRRVFAHVMASEGDAALTEDEADAFLRVLNEARLVLGVRLGIEVEEDYEKLDPDQTWILDYFAYLQEELMYELTRRWEDE